MRTVFRYLSSLHLLLCLHIDSHAQESDPYHLNGSAYQENCNCYTITDDKLWESGSVWNKNKISLLNSFDYKFNVYLGCKDLDGADGIVFVLQPISTNVGSTGGGLGYKGVTPSVGVAIDTYQNLENSDPSYDHIDIFKNGDIDVGTTNTLAGPFDAIAGGGNIEDCQFHTFRIIWNAGTKSLSAEIDGIPRIQTTVDLVPDIFSGKDSVFWGFTGSTGGLSNHQRICTSLNPGFSMPADQKTCYPTPVLFHDSSASFGSILKWYWDFGDGTIDSVENPAAHVFPATGIYNVKLNILGNNGCLSDTFTHQIVAGSKPTAAFSYLPVVACTNSTLVFTDQSFVQYGTIDQWNWNINYGAQLIVNDTAGLHENFPKGFQNIQLITDTKEGCESDPYFTTIEVFQPPQTNISLEDACYGNPVLLSAGIADPSVSIRQWHWELGDGSLDSSNSVSHIYPARGTYTVKLFAESVEGCYSDTLTGNLTIYQTNANAGRDTASVIDQPMPLHGSGGDFYQWSPATGLNDPTSANPIATLDQDQTYVLTASTPFGCETKDTVQIKVYKGPAIYVPSAFTPDLAMNNRFRYVAVGITNIIFFRIYNRLGQLVYDNQNHKDGWDGTLNGQPQATGAYVWMVKGMDYNGLLHYKQGSFVLIR